MGAATAWGKLESLAAPSPTSAFALPSSIHRGMEESPAERSLGGNRDGPPLPGGSRLSQQPPEHQHHPPTPLHHPSGDGSNTPRLSVWGHHPAASLGAPSIIQPGGSTPRPPDPPKHHLCPPSPLHHPSGVGSITPRLSVWGHHPAASLGASSIAQPGGSIPSPAAPSPPQSTTSALPLLSTISQEVGAPPACGFGGIA